MKRKIFVLIMVVSLLVVLVGCSKSTPEASNQNGLKAKEIYNAQMERNNTNTQPAKSQKQQLRPRDFERFNGEGGIAMSIIFANPLKQNKEGYLTFVAQMDNHAYNLDDYDLSKYVALVDDKGNSPEGQPKWELYSGGGHHVINYLLFPDNGFITPETEYIKLIITDFIDVPVREFVWEKEFLGIKE